MWAMIGTCIALGIWTTGVLWFSIRAERRREVVSVEVIPVDDKGLEVEKSVA